MRLLLIPIATFIIVGCGGGSSGDTTPSTAQTLPTSHTKDDGRLLASQCAQCHGTDGYSKSSWDSIAGEDELLEEFREYSVSHIMGAQAKGYSDSEVLLMQDYLSKLKEADD